MEKKEKSVKEKAAEAGVSVKTFYSRMGKKEGVSVEMEGEFLVIKIPKKQALKEILGGMI